MLDTVGDVTAEAAEELDEAGKAVAEATTPPDDGAAEPSEADVTSG